MDCVVLFSGGLDSTTMLAIAKQSYNKIYAISFDYGQRHKYELESAVAIASHYGVSHKIVKIDTSIFESSNCSLTNMKYEVEVEHNQQVPSTYVAGRNNLFAAIGMSYAESVNADALMLGVNASDYENYPDCRPAFVEALANLSNVAMRDPIQILAPLLYMTKSDIIKFGINIGVDYSMTHSCYSPDSFGLACGVCLSCTLRKQGFINANIADPTRYSSLSKASS